MFVGVGQRHACTHTRTHLLLGEQELHVRRAGGAETGSHLHDLLLALEQVLVGGLRVLAPGGHLLAGLRVC